MKESVVLLLLAGLLSLLVKYGLVGIPLRPAPGILAALVLGPALGMALWLMWSRPLKTVKINVQNKENESP